MVQDATCIGIKKTKYLDLFTLRVLFVRRPAGDEIKFFRSPSSMSENNANLIGNMSKIILKCIKYAN